MDLELLGIIALLLLVVLLFSPIGLGGGLLYVPILHYIGGLPFETAIVGSLVMVLCTAVGSSQAHRAERMVATDRVKVAVWTALPAATVGALSSLWVIEQVSDLQVKLVTMGLTGWVLWRAIQRLRADAGTEGGDVGEFTPSTYRIGTAVGGFACGALGIGGGAIYVTMNRGWGGLAIKEAACTSFMIASCVVPVAITTHILAGGVGPLGDLPLAALVLTPLLALATAFLGGRYAARHLPVGIISAVFIAMVSMGLLRYLADFIPA